MSTAICPSPRDKGWTQKSIWTYQQISSYLSHTAALLVDPHLANSTIALTHPIIDISDTLVNLVFNCFLTNFGRRLLNHSVNVEQPLALQMLSNALLSTPPNAHFNLEQVFSIFSSSKSLHKRGGEYLEKQTRPVGTDTCWPIFSCKVGRHLDSR